MDPTIRSLINALPALPPRTDSALEQLEDLIEIAKRLGMGHVAVHLLEQTATARKYYGPKPLHPEQLAGEVHLLDSDPATVRYIGWKTKRTGTRSFDDRGEVLPGKVPVFVAAEELAAAGQLTSRDTVKE